MITHSGIRAEGPYISGREWSQLGRRIAWLGWDSVLDIYSQIQPCREAVRALQNSGHTVGLVPTMGALHEGHLSLIRAAAKECSKTAVTIFVNPTQFGPQEDLAAYPRTPDADLDACRSLGVDFVFAPDVATMYPGDTTTTVHVDRLTEGLCGAFRPGHFDGVTTVVAKLLNILPANRAYFGEKDYQQLVVIRRMVRDLNIPIEIVACPTVREPDGMAMSSRNRYLDPDQRRQAATLSRALFAAADAVAKGECDTARLTRDIRGLIEAAGPVTIDYVEIVNPDSLEPVARINGPARICLAVRIGSCRLIDNIGVDPRGHPA